MKKIVLCFLFILLLLPITPVKASEKEVEVTSDYILLYNLFYSASLLY